MTRVPYTPDAVAKLRANAARGANGCAEMLGWPVDFVVAVARRHGIELMVVQAAVTSVPAPKPALPLPPAPAPKPAPRKVPRASTFNAATAPWNTDGVLGNLLSARECQAFDVLYGYTGPRLSSRQIGQRMGIDYDAGVILATLTAKLRRTAYRIDAQKGQGGGYTLIKPSAPSQATAAESAPGAASAAAAAPVPATHRHPQGRA